MTTPTPQKLGLDDLARSGLTAAHAKKLNLRFIDATASSKLFPSQPYPATVIPYYTAEGKPRPDGLFRVRFHMQPKKGAFGEKTHIPKYSQPKGSPCGAYFAQLYDWKPVLADPTKPLWITEGEKKAAKACAEGFACIGLGGVSSIRQKNTGLSLLPELEAIDWSGRQVFVAFDSDVTVKPDVAAALGRLCHELGFRRGAVVRMVLLPAEDDEKVGLDDYLLTHTAAELQKLGEDTLPDELLTRLWEYNSRFIYVNNISQIAEKETENLHGQLVVTTMKKDSFLTNYGNDIAQTVTQKRDAKGNVTTSTKEVPVAELWLKWPQRLSCNGLAYEPDGPRLFNGHYNTWNGLACEPVKGDITPWKKLLDIVFERDPVARTWFERWCAWPLITTNMDKKQTTAVCLWGWPGTGKSTIGDTFSRIYGEHYSLIKQDDLEGAFNTWMIRKQFVVIDDVDAHHTRRKNTIFKSLITSKTFQANTKFVPAYDQVNKANFFITSNHEDAIFVEPGDRRFFIQNVPQTGLTREFYESYQGWLANGGASALLYHLQNLDMGDYSPHVAPVVTDAKRAMMETCMGDVHEWIVDTLLQGSRLGDVFRAAELASMYNAQATGRKVSPRLMARHLTEAGIRMRRVQAEGVDVKLFMLSNADRWERADAKAILKEHEKGGGAAMMGAKIS